MMSDDSIDKAHARTKFLSLLTARKEAEVPADEEILRVEGLRMHFPVRGGVLYRQTGSVKAVDGVDLTIRKGETLGLVGESGCGKSTLGKCIVRLLNPTGGRVVFKGTELTHMSQSALRTYRQDFQMVFQDPAESLDARMSVGELISEPMVIQGIGTRPERVRRVEELLELVGQVAPHTLILGHGDAPAQEWFKAEVGRRWPSIRILLPEPGQPVEIATP